MFVGSASIKGNPTRTNVTASTARAMIATANANRKSILFQNQGTETVYLGGPDVGTTGAGRGYALFASATFTDDATFTEWWAVTAANTAVVHIEEVS